MIRFLCLILVGFASQCGALAQDKSELPTLVSLDYCADQYLLGLADPSQILALSPDADKPFSHYRDRAKELPQSRLSAEEILILKPDIILRSYGGTPRDLEFYQRFGLQVVNIGFANDFAGVADVVESIALKLGRSTEAQEHISRLRQAAPESRGSALYITPGGVTAGDETLVADLLRQSGLGNLGGPGYWPAMSLETLILSPPDLAISAFFNFGAEATSHWGLGRHAAMRRLLNQIDVVPIREDRISCTSWLVADEAADLQSVISGLVP